MRRRPRFRSASAALLALLCLGGCASQPPTDAPRPAASATAIATAAGSSAVRRNVRATCAEGDPCAGDEVCCRARGTPPSAAICAPSQRASPVEKVDERADLVAACAAALPGPADSTGPIRSWIALACTDSSDCGADRLCLLDDPDRASAVRSLTGTCVPYAEPTGLQELCSRGTCKLPNSVCAAAEPDVARVCVSGAGPRCADVTCRPGEACDAFESRCVRSQPVEELQFAYRCTRASECPGGLECCVGPHRSECSASCDFAFFFPTCDDDVECPLAGLWTEMHCAAVADGPAPMRACSPYP